MTRSTNEFDRRTTHFRPYDSPLRALCGALVSQTGGHSIAPTCPECRRLLVEDEAALTAMHEDR